MLRLGDGGTSSLPQPTWLVPSTVRSRLAQRLPVDGGKARAIRLERIAPQLHSFPWYSLVQLPLLCWRDAECRPFASSPMVALSLDWEVAGNTGTPRWGGPSTSFPNPNRRSGPVLAGPVCVSVNPSPRGVHWVSSRTTSMLRFRFLPCRDPTGTLRGMSFGHEFEHFAIPDIRFRSPREEENCGFCQARRAAIGRFMRPGRRVCRHCCRSADALESLGTPSSVLHDVGLPARPAPDVEPMGQVQHLRLFVPAICCLALVISGIVSTFGTGFPRGYGLARGESV